MLKVVVHIFFVSIDFKFYVLNFTLLSQSQRRGKGYLIKKNVNIDTLKHIKTNECTPETTGTLPNYDLVFRFIVEFFFISYVQK